MIKLIPMMVMLFVGPLATADTMDMPRTVQSCTTYKLVPSFFRVPMLRRAIQGRLREMEASPEIIDCSGERFRLKEADKAIVKLCKQGIDLDSAAHSIITIHVANCYMDNA